MGNYYVAFYLIVVWGLQSSMQDRSVIDIDAEAASQEYCIATEPFEAKCLKNEVIVMTSALYGRMRVGRCLEDVGAEMLARNANDPLFLGCFMDVVNTLDRRCSGKNLCEVKLISDPELQRERPCHSGLTNYLEASYECVTVIEADRSCHVSVTSNPLHIMRSSTTKLSCGAKSQPWTLEAPVGQQINVSLLDFGQRAREPENQQHCQQNGYVVDKAVNKNVSICGSKGERRKIVFQSTSNVIQVVLNSGKNENKDQITHDRDILLGFVAVGCSNPVPPEDTWLRRDNNEAVVGCYSSRQSWHLRCVNNMWIGVIGNCSRESALPEVLEMQKQPLAFDNQVLLAIAVAFVGLLICIAVIICGIFCMRRYGKLNEDHSKHSRQLLTDSQPSQCQRELAALRMEQAS